MSKLGSRGIGVGQNVDDSILIPGNSNSVSSVDINLAKEDTLEHRVTQLENIVYGVPRYRIQGVLPELQQIRETLNDIQLIVHSRNEKLDYRLLLSILFGTALMLVVLGYAILRIAV